MLHRLLARSPDLQRLVNEGFNVSIVSAHLVIDDVPYVTKERSIGRGQIVTPIGDVSGDATVAPSDHTIWFTQKDPCDAQGVVLERYMASYDPNAQGQTLADGLVAYHHFSQKPVGGRQYPDYYAKMTTYVTLLQQHAQQIDPEATARTYPPLPSPADDAIFQYIDNASTRAGIVVANEKLRVQRVAIIGLGGTGSHILDLLAKTPAGEIHLFDGDYFLNHNAFRAPGAASLDDLAARPTKVDYYTAMYQKMRSGIIPHPYYMTPVRHAELQNMDFVFLAFDGGPGKRELLTYLADHAIDCIDVGMGVLERNGSLMGQLRVSALGASNRGQATNRSLFPCAASDDDNDYDRNIQVDDLNALNATLAVIKYKKMRGFYNADGHETMSLYSIAGNCIIGEQTV